MITKIKAHIAYWREAYIWPVICAAFVLGSLHLVLWLTGHPAPDDPGVLVDSAYRLAQLFAVAFFVALVDGHLFNDLDAEAWRFASLGEKILDVSKTLALFGLALWFLHN